MTTNENEIVVYEPDETIRLDVRLDDDTVWLTQNQMTDLFQRDRTVITRHINNVFSEGELDEKSNVHFLHIPFSDKPVKVDRRLAKHDDRLATLEQKVDFFVQTQTPPLQGVFYDGQLWDARALVLKLIQSAKRSLILIDNWAMNECCHCENVASHQFQFPMKEAA